MSLGTCSRSNDVVKPMIKPQWFVNCQTNGQKSRLFRNNMNKTATGIFLLLLPISGMCHAFQIIPNNMNKCDSSTIVLADGLKNIHDWCFSRQIWWGHRVPAW
jgi:valyl-tRNA synthetase